MPKTYADFIAYTNLHLTDEKVLSTADLRKLIDNAFLFYSTVYPRYVSSLITGDGTGTYALPSTWVDGFSDLAFVEYPHGNQDPTRIDRKLVVLYRDENGVLKLRFRAQKPSTSEKFLLTFTVTHTIDDSTSTMPDPHFEAVASLVVSEACFALALKFAQARDPVMAADSINLRSKAEELRSLAVDFRKKFFALLGLSEGVSAETVLIDWDTPPSWKTFQLTHPDH